MRVDAGIPRSTSELLLVTKGDVLVGDGVAISFAKAHIDKVQNVGIGSKTHQEVVWLDIAVQIVIAMLRFDSVQLSTREDTNQK